jgi:hypothetical protein
MADVEAVTVLFRHAVVVPFDFSHVDSPCGKEDASEDALCLFVYAVQVW